MGYLGGQTVAMAMYVHPSADIDECLSQPEPCEQECTNNIGSFECTCNTGYRLQGNGRNCSGGCS